MAISGYGLTLVGTSIGAISGIEDVTVGGVRVEFSEVKQDADTNRIP